MTISKFMSIAFAGFSIIAGASIVTACSGSTKQSDSVNDSISASNENGKEHRPHGFKIDKSGDAVLQSMIKDVAPKFKQYVYSVPGKDTKIEYSLFSPEKVDPAKKYPLVMFIADASTAGREVTAPLTQGYGALVWATPESQAQNPCYVLVPQLAEGATNDAYEHSPQVDDVISLVKSIQTNYQVDSNRIYSTGQSMGGMISMYYDVAYPDLFAASIFVDSHWDQASFPELVKHKFVWFIAGDGGKAYPTMVPLEEAARKAGVQYTFAAWSAKLPEARQSELAQVMLDKGAPINIFEFETGSVLPEGKTDGIDHMYSFDYAYRVKAVRDWLFKQSK